MTCNYCALHILGVIASILVILKIYVKFTTGWCRSQTCLVGKTALVTGANTGIGFETAIDLAKRGARVILACRNMDKAEEAKKRIIKETDNANIIVKKLDLSSFASARKFAKDINENEKRLDLLVNNAGLGGVGDLQTEDGNQMVIQSNFLSPFLLTILLIGLLKKTGNSRIVNVSSTSGQYARLNIDTLNGYPGHLPIYARSKLCNILFTIELAAKLANSSDVTTYSLHPGIVLTDFFRNLNFVKRIVAQFFVENLYKNSLEGAQTSIYLCVEKGIEYLNGEHFHDCHVVARYKTARDPGMAKKLWEVAEQLAKVTPEDLKDLNA